MRPALSRPTARLAAAYRAGLDPPRRLALLEKRGIAQAEIEYDGYSDSGQVEQQGFFHQDDEELTVQERGVMVGAATA